MARPRVYPPGENYLKRSRAALAARGGKILSISLEAAELVALDTLCQEWSLNRTETVKKPAEIRAATRFLILIVNGAITLHLPFGKALDGKGVHMVAVIFFGILFLMAALLTPIRWYWLAIFRYWQPSLQPL